MPCPISHVCHGFDQSTLFLDPAGKLTYHYKCCNEEWEATFAFISWSVHDLTRLNKIIGNRNTTTYQTTLFLDSVQGLRYCQHRHPHLTLLDITKYVLAIDKQKSQEEKETGETVLDPSGLVQKELHFNLLGLLDTKLPDPGGFDVASWWKALEKLPSVSAQQEDESREMWPSILNDYDALMRAFEAQKQRLLDNKKLIIINGSGKRFRPLNCRKTQPIYYKYLT